MTVEKSQSQTLKMYSHDPLCGQDCYCSSVCDDVVCNCDLITRVREDERALIADRMRPILAAHRISLWALDSSMAELRKACDKVPPPLPPSVGVPEKWRP